MHSLQILDVPFSARVRLFKRISVSVFLSFYDGKQVNVFLFQTLTTPNNGILVSCQGTKFYSTLNQSSHVPLLSILWLMMRFQQDSGLFLTPEFITPASCSILSVPKRERPINACLIGMLWQENMDNICNILIARLSP